MPKDYSGSYTRGEWDSIVSVLKDKVPFVNAGEVNADTVRTDSATITNAGELPNDADDTVLTKSSRIVLGAGGSAFIDIVPGKTQIKQTVSFRSAHGINDIVSIGYAPQNVLNLSSPSAGDVAFHDGTDGTSTNSEGLAEYRSDGSWYHLASGNTIS